LVSEVVLLDSGPLGLLSHPKQSPQSIACTRWLRSKVEDRARILGPEIADYETRRELLRAGKRKGIAKLDALAEMLEYLPLTTEAMRRAAQLWAEARQRGQPTAGDKTIDADVILAAQALTLGTDEALVVTTNVGHLERFVRAVPWTEA
jgi:predicted nucleic acid-binding protein